MIESRTDTECIERIVREMFAAISWDETSRPDWQAFKAPVLPGAPLYPAARPVKPTAIDPFADMMDGQRTSGNLRTFAERVLGVRVQVFGNVATAMASYAASINGGPEQRGVNAFLLVKTDGEWRIGAMSWDNENEQQRMPAELLQP